MVVGAGFAGLVAARELTRRGRDVLVVEGRDRVGGRSHTGSVGGVPVDLGATFVGPTQDAVLALARELGCPTTATFDQGRNVIRWRGRTRTYSGTIPRLSLPSLLDIGRVRWLFARSAQRVPVAEPWTAPDAGRLDGMSLGGWLRSVHASRSSRDLMAIAARVTWGAEPDEVSMLHALRYVKAAGGLDRMLDTGGGAQQDRLVAGTQDIAVRMAAELHPRVRRNAPVHAVDHRPDGVTVHTGDDALDAQRVIVAIPPAHRAAIAFRPALPPPYAGLQQRWPQGVLSKAYAVYDRPFWRDDGRSGQGLSDEGPVFITFDVSPAPAGPGVLLGFADARTFDPLPPAERRRQALRGFAALFGDRALTPLDYADHRWGAEVFAPGGPTAAVPPGSWTRFGPWLRAPVGPIHWAGTETADTWTGFLDGAVRSGQRAAAEVDATLSGTEGKIHGAR